MLLDGNALIHRAYHALPPLTAKGGEVVNAVYGFAMTLLSVLEKWKPDYIAASFDLSGPTFRDELYEDYKATRQKAPDDLYAQIPRVKEVVQAFNIPIYEKKGFEADDCVGTLARQAEKENVETIIVTGDNDTLQLVTPLTKVFSIRKGIKDLVLYDEEAVQKKYGFAPARLIEYKGLAGDQSDNIPGVKGVGEKTATDLVQQYGTLENLYAHLGDVKESVRKKLEADKENAFLSRTLGTIDTQAPVALDLHAAVTHEYDRGKVEELFRNLGFFSLLKRLPGSTSEQSGQDGKELRKGKGGSRKLKDVGELERWLEQNKGSGTAVWIARGEASLFGGAGIKEVRLAVTEDAEVFIQWNEEAKSVLKSFFENEKRSKILYDAKSMMHLLAQEQIILNGVARDTMLLAYLLDSGGEVSFESLILRELPAAFSVDAPASTLYALNTKLGTEIKRVSKEQTNGKTLLDVYGNIELPLVPVLFRTEQNGIRLNKKKFSVLSEELSVELAALEKDIYALAGRGFNINSPKQLAEILFEDLHIPTTNIKKTKTGISTAASELQKLAAYPIVQKIEQYRELFKLKTTYLDVLPGLVDTDARLHTTFHQTVAATGRLSSSDPNLQNIPARNTWSERIRGAFEAEEGFRLVGADYSQIELRVMAHMCKDKALTEAFMRGEDVHTKTAAVVYKVKPEEVTPDMRRQAKVFNFGIMYGMGSFGLAQAAQIDQKEAAQFIAAYFKKFSGVKKFMEEMKRMAREQGYVETETGRRRYVPEITSQNIQVARAAERVAINMPIQGLAADIMKLSMLAAQKIVEAYGKDARMVLQIHDELIFEVCKDRAEGFAEEIREVMERAYPLCVPLEAVVAIGKNWGEI